MESSQHTRSQWSVLLRLSLGIFVAISIYGLSGALAFPAEMDPYPARRAAAITAFVTTGWLSQALPLGAMSLFPMVLMPLAGVMPIQNSATAYAHPIIWLFFGGFILSLGVERWGLHKRIALRIIRALGTNPSRLILGFMLAAAFLSMWMTNTTTTLVLLPVAIAVSESLSALVTKSKDTDAKQFAPALLLGIAYACSIGGTGTPIGTAPNALFLSNYTTLVNQGAPPISFLQWLVMGSMFILIMLPLLWLLLTKILFKLPHITTQSKNDLLASSHLQIMTSAEKRMAFLFGLAALLWITRRDIGFGTFVFPGWWRVFPVENANAIGDGLVAVLIALLAFIIPAGRPYHVPLMDWKTAKSLPWDILLLFGGGIAIARAFTETGLAKVIGLSFEPIIKSLPVWILILIICVVQQFD